MADQNAYLDMFVEESRDHIQALNDNLMALEGSPEDHDLVNSIFRSAHTLKGMAATMGFDKMAHLTHEMEDGLDKVRTGQLKITPSLMDVLFRCIDLLENQLESIVHTGLEGNLNNEGNLDIDSVVRELASVLTKDADQTVNATSLGTVNATRPRPVSATPTDTRPDAGTVQLQSDLATVPVRLSAEIDSLLADTELLVMEANNQGLQTYVVQVTLEPTAIMPGVRAFMVVRALEELGDVVKSEPDAKQLEEGDFTGVFQLLVVTHETEATVQSAVLRIMDVQSVVVQTPDSWREGQGVVQEVVGEVVGEVVEARIPDESGGKDKSLRDKPLTELQSAAATSSPLSYKAAKTSGKSIRVDVERLDALMNLFSEFVIDKTRLEMISRSSKDTVLNETVQHLSRVGTDLQAIVMKMRMIPLETVFNRFPRMVRDLAKNLDKKVNFVVLGAETELDRILVEDLADPLVHILRNSLDHGLEKPQERSKLGKDEVGKVQLFAYQAGNHVYIEIEDDGRGIDRAKVLQKAISQGMLSQAKANDLTDTQVFDLLFASGFSTAQTVTDISGRGVGLDAAKNTIVGLGGNVFVESTLGKGTKFTIELPLTLSIMDAMLIKVAQETYAIPLNSILQIERLPMDVIQSVHGKPMVPYRSRVIPLIDLRHKLAIAEGYPTSEQLLVAIVNKGDKWYAARIDSVLGQQEIVLKSLGKYLQGAVDVVSGSTILGDGQVALILDPNSITR